MIKSILVISLILAPAVVLAGGSHHGNNYCKQRGQFEDIAGHENNHVDFLVTALGANARPKPAFQNLEQATLSEFITIAQALENTGVGAYLGALPYISTGGLASAAGSLALIEARHAGYLNNLKGSPITGNAKDNKMDFPREEPLTLAEVLAAAGPFFADLKGKDVTYDTTPSAANDLDILNFALALEYLEAEFYNLNIVKFFPTVRHHVSSHMSML